MKKLLIAMLIACNLGLVACGEANTETPSTNNSGTGVTDGTNSTNGTNSANGTTDTNGNGTTNGTNSNTGDMTNNQGSSSDESKTSLNNLYTEFKGKVEGGIENINDKDWDQYSTEFKGKLTNLRNTVGNTSMGSTLDDMENLFNQYDTSIRGKTDIDKAKVQEMHTKIEGQLR